MKTPLFLSFQSADMISMCLYLLYINVYLFSMYFVK